MNVHGILALRHQTQQGAVGGVRERWTQGGLSSLVRRFDTGVAESLYPSIIFPGHHGQEAGRIVRLALHDDGLSFAGELSDNPIVASLVRLLSGGVLPVSPTIKAIRRVRDVSGESDAVMAVDGLLWQIAVLQHEAPAYRGSSLRLG